MKRFFEVKGVDSKGEVKMNSRTITGYFSRFGNVDSDGDMLVPGAFEKTIKERGQGGLIKHLTDHRFDTDHLIGIPKVWEVSDGAMFETVVSDTTKGNDILKLYRDGVINQHSFGFKTLKESKKSAYNEISEVMLYEVSTVVLGANSETPFTGFKGMKGDELLQQYELLVKCYENGDYSDDVFPILKAQMDQIKEQMIFEYMQMKTQTTQPERTATTEPESKDVWKEAISTLIIKNYF